MVLYEVMMEKDGGVEKLGVSLVFEQGDVIGLSFSLARSDLQDSPVLSYLHLNLVLFLFHALPFSSLESYGKRETQ